MPMVQIDVAEGGDPAAGVGPLDEEFGGHDESVPRVPPAEQRRFLDARKGDRAGAVRVLKSHLAWREASLPLPASAPRIGRELPPWVSFDGLALDGTPLLFALGALFDSALGSVMEHVLAIAQVPRETAPRSRASHGASTARPSQVLDEHLDRTLPTKITIVIDVRGNRGWPNPPPTELFPTIRALSSTLAPNFPERLARAVVFPVPWIARAIWAAARQFLDPDTASKFVLLGGPDTSNSPVRQLMPSRPACSARPRISRRSPLLQVPSRLAEFVGERGLDVLERKRSQPAHRYDASGGDAVADG